MGISIVPVNLFQRKTELKRLGDFFGDATSDRVAQVFARFEPLFGPLDHIRADIRTGLGQIGYARDFGRSCGVGRNLDLVDDLFGLCG
jgi:hypothetical protein